MNIRECREKQGGFVRDVDLPDIKAEDRLCPCIVRCGCGRFTCAVQSVAHFVAIITREGSDYIRDVSIKPDYTPPAASSPVGATWDNAAVPSDERSTLARSGSVMAAGTYSGDGSEFGGVWDGNGIISDADPGL